jgi:Fis family transcriptional regulator
MNTNKENENTLSQHVKVALDNYFNNLDGQHTTNLYEMVIKEIEKPLLESVLAYNNNNQSLAAKILGLSRGTLRKKMQKYELLE